MTKSFYCLYLGSYIKKNVRTHGNLEHYSLYTQITKLLCDWRIIEGTVQEEYIFSNVFPVPVAEFSE